MLSTLTSMSVSVSVTSRRVTRKGHPQNSVQGENKTIAGSLLIRSQAARCSRSKVGAGGDMQRS